jgi:hypothetical protein
VWAIAACTAARSDGDHLSRQAVAQMAIKASELVAAGRPVRWVSPYEVCVPGLDAASIPECQTRAKVPIDSVVYTQLRRALRVEQGGRGEIACLRVSRVIPSGDSSLVAVATIGTAEADGFVESRMEWVVFRGDQARVARDSRETSSDVAPLQKEFQCR